MYLYYHLMITLINKDKHIRSSKSYVMVLENFSQNKSRSESNVSKNIPKPCASNSSGPQVKKLIQKYEELSVSAKNINLKCAYRHSSCGELSSVKNSEMISDSAISLNRNTVSRFLSLENDNKYVINDYKKNNSDVKYNCDIKMPSHSKKSSKSNYKYVDESDRDRKQSQATTPASGRRKDDIWKIFTPFNETDKDKKNDYHRSLSKETKKENNSTDKDRQYCNSLPSKKKETSFGKNFIRSFSATTSRDKKLKPVSNQKDKLKTIPKDGNVKEDTGAIRKQTNPDDIIYRKRRNSYLMATQNDDNFRKLKIFPEKPDKKQSHVSKTISKFENEIMTVVDVTTRTSTKFEQEIKQLFQQYHDNNKFGTSNKMTREELSLEIDNVLLNKFKQISRDSTPEKSTATSGADHNTNNSSIPLKPIEESLEQHNIETEYVIIMRNSSTDEMSTDVGQGQNVDLDFDTESEINIREKLTTELNRVLSDDSFKGSVENLCDDLEKAINSSLPADERIKSICVVDSDEENSFETIERTVNSYLDETERVYENLNQEENNSEQVIPNENQYINAIEPIYENFEIRRESVHITNHEENHSDQTLSDETQQINDINSTEPIYENFEIRRENTNQENSYQEEQEPDCNQNMKDIEANPELYENLQYIQNEQINEENNVTLRDPDETKPKIRVSNLVSYFSDKIAEISSAATVERKTSFSKSRKQSFNDDVFTSPSSENEYRFSRVSTPEVQIEAFNPELSSGSFVTDSSFEDDKQNGANGVRITCIDEQLYEEAQKINNSFENIVQNGPEERLKSPGVRITCIDDELYKKLPNEDILNNQTPRNSALYRNKSFNSTTSSDEFEYINCKYRKKSIHEQAKILQDELKVIENKYEQEPTEETTEHKPRFSRLYSGKFSRHSSVLTKTPDTNNNECKVKNVDQENEQSITTIEVKNEVINNEIINNNNEEANDEQIYRRIQQDTLFFSDSDGDYDLKEACNYNSKFISLQRKLSTSDWVDNTVQQIQNFRSKSYDDFDVEEDTEHIYEKIKRSGSQGTLCTIFDEQNNPTIRMSMMDITGEYAEVVENQTMEKAERELRKNIEEIQDNSKKACLINELITSEKYYINTSLHRIVVDYMPEMNKENIPNYPKGLVGKSRQIFGNADLLYEEHKHKFLPQLEKHTTIDELATCFLDHETLFKLYPLYSKNKPKSELIMRDFGAYFKAKQDELNDKLDLPSYLLTPIQRLAKYCLLLRSIVKECEKENNDTEEHKVGLEKLKRALELVNKQMRMGNDLIALDSVVGYNGNIREHGEVLLRDTFMVQPPSKKGQAYEGMVFLFQECFLITAVNRQDHKELFVYKESFQLTDMGYSDIESDPPEFSVWFRKRDNNNYRFRTKNQDLKQKWVKEIFNLLWKQLEANKRRRKKELEESGVKDTRVPVVRPYSVPNKGKESPSTGYSSTKPRKRTLNSSSTDTIWYTK